MAILIDPPRWPAHGTLFGHLVSDLSLDDLHAFAGAAGLSPRAFDHDHYDVPMARYPELVAAGALEVPSSELLKRLVAAGLRVRQRDRTPSRPAARALAEVGWDAMLPHQPGLRDDLLRRWSQEHRSYHDVRHLAQCLAALETLGARPSTDRPVLLAAWFHDAVHHGQPGRDEQASADLAQDLLAGVVPAAEVALVRRLVLSTMHHDPAAGDRDAALLSDADLSVLGLNRGRYHVYARDVREEYRRFSDAEFRHGRLGVLTDLLGRDHLFHTDVGRALWDEPARRNLAEEKARLLGARP